MTQVPPGYIADPTIFACPDGIYCEDPVCIAEFVRRAEQVLGVERNPDGSIKLNNDERKLVEDCSK